MHFFFTLVSEHFLSASLNHLLLTVAKEHLPNFLFVNIESLFTCKRLAETMEGNHVPALAAALDVRIDTSEKRRVWVHEINQARNQTVLIS